MPTVVIPFAGTRGKTRLEAPAGMRRELSLAMLEDVLAAAVAVGETRVVTSDAEGARRARMCGAGVVDDPGGGQGAAVAHALGGVTSGPFLVVNADLPCVRPEELHALLAAAGADGFALAAAADGTTNALCLPVSSAFAPVYGPGSAARFLARAAALGLAAVEVGAPNLVDDVDTLADLERLRPRLGPRSLAALDRASIGAPT